MKLLKLLLSFSLLTMLGMTQAWSDEGWSLARDRDGIQVWTRDVADFPIREFKAVTTVKSSLNGLVGLIMDTANAGQWIYRTSRVELLQRDDDKGYFLIHVETDFPWPLTDRDAVVEGRITQDEKTRVVTVRSHSLPLSQYPAKPDFVRMPEMQGTWIFRPLDQGRVEVTMLGRADPGGRIPASAVNLLIHETPYRTLQGLRRVVAAPQYQKSVLPQIREVTDRSE